MVPVERNLNFFGTFLDEMKRGEDTETLLKDLSALFDKVAQASEKVPDAATRSELAVAAARGKEKINTLRHLIK
jgi:hypothetical protein